MRLLGGPAVAGALVTGALLATTSPAPANPPTSHQVCEVPGRAQTLDDLWHPDMSAAIAYAHGRTGDIAFAVRTRGSFYGYRQFHQEWSASVLKAMMMVAYLDMPSVANRPLNSSDTSLLDPMITQSDNAAADVVDQIVGTSGLDALAARLKLRGFAATAPIWGESLITPANQTRFFLHIDRDIVQRHRAYAMHLLASITPSQRWGIGEVAPRGWSLYFKGGWGSGTGLIDHQVALFSRGCARFSVAVLTMNDGSHDYGKETLRNMFHILLRGLPTGPHMHYQ